MGGDGVLDAQRFDGGGVLQAEARDGGGAVVGGKTRFFEVGGYEGGGDGGEDADGGEGESNCSELPGEHEHEVEDDAGAEQTLKRLLRKMSAGGGCGCLQGVRHVHAERLLQQRHVLDQRVAAGLELALRWRVKHHDTRAGGGGGTCASSCRPRCMVQRSTRRRSLHASASPAMRNMAYAHASATEAAK